MTKATPLTSNLMQNNESASISETNGAPQEADRNQVAGNSRASDDDEVKAYFSDLLGRIQRKNANVSDQPKATQGAATFVRNANLSLVVLQSTEWRMPPPRRIAPERRLDRRVLRELAMEQARSAIYLSEKKKFREEAKTCLVVAIVAVFLALAFLEWAPAVHKVLVFAAWLPCAISLVCVSRIWHMSMKLRCLIPIRS